MKMNYENDLFNKISNEVLDDYYKKMNDTLIHFQGKITEHQLATTIMNLSLVVSVSIFYSLRDFLPTHQFDIERVSQLLSSRIEEGLRKFEDHEKNRYVS